jgi:hypothetical protein
MKTDTNATTATPTTSAEKYRLEPGSSAFARAETRLDAEFAERVKEANGTMSIPVAPRMMREQWQFVAYLAEEQGKSIDDVCGNLLDAAIDEAQAEYMANLPRK